MKQNRICKTTVLPLNGEILLHFLLTLKKYIITLLLIIQVVLVQGQHGADTFSNPLLPSGADPWSIYKDGYYYYTHTSGDKLVIRKTRSLAELATADTEIIWQPPSGTMYSKHLWAPELHFIDGSWYMYFAADDGKNENHRIYVLQNDAADPLDGNWTFKGKVSDPSDRWAIDASVFKHNGQLYMMWSGWEGYTDGRQDLYIAKMKNPWTIEGERKRISTPTHAWERHGDLERGGKPFHVSVNEGPQILSHKDKLFVVYSASGCWTEHYALGMLTTTATANLLDSTSWQKSAQPVFTPSPENGVYAPGHNSFFKSPDGTEDWILYHANPEPGRGCGGSRSPRAQKFTWKKDGTPDFGVPVSVKLPLEKPSEKNLTNKDRD
jgi:GH43 family beta-xylosidase